MLQLEETTLTKQISRNAIYSDRGPECIYAQFAQILCIY